MSALGGPRPDDVLERLGREKEAEVVTGVFTIPLARMGPLCRSIDLDPAMLVQALGMQGARARKFRCVRKCCVHKDWLRSRFGQVWKSLTI